MAPARLRRPPDAGTNAPDPTPSPAQVRDAGNLLTRAGLSLPSVDVDDIEVQYRCVAGMATPPRRGRRASWAGKRGFASARWSAGAACSGEACLQGLLVCWPLTAEPLLAQRLPGPREAPEDDGRNHRAEAALGLPAPRPRAGHSGRVSLPVPRREGGRRRRACHVPGAAGTVLSRWPWRLTDWARPLGQHLIGHASGLLATASRRRRMPGSIHSVPLLRPLLRTGGLHHGLVSGPVPAPGRSAGQRHGEPRRPAARLGAPKPCTRCRARNGGGLSTQAACSTRRCAACAWPSRPRGSATSQVWPRVGLLACCFI